MNAVISVIGKDCVGILAYVSDECAKANAKHFRCVTKCF